MGGPPVDRPRSGRPTVHDQQAVERILFLTTERVPVEATPWSTRLMARYAGVSPLASAAGQAADGKPHRLKTFKLSQNSQVAERVIDIVGLYLNPPANARVLSVDEKMQIQALDRTPPMLPLRPGQVEPGPRLQATRNRQSVCRLQRGDRGRLGRITRCQRGTEFRQFLAQIDRATPPDLTLHLIPRQQQHAHDRGDSGLLGRASALSPAFSRRPVRRGSTQSRPRTGRKNPVRQATQPLPSLARRPPPGTTQCRQC